MSTAIAVRDPNDQLSMWDQMIREIQTLGESQLFPHIKTVQQGVAIALMGRDLGISITRAIYGINVIEGKPSLSAALMAELILKHHGGNALHYEVSNSTECTIIYKRKDSTREGKFTYTIEDAKRAGLDSKPPWKKDPTSMLRNRCLTNVARMGFADVIAGSYLTEEMQDEGRPVEVVETSSWNPSVQEEPTPTRTLPKGVVFTEAGNFVDETTGEVIMQAPPINTSASPMTDEQRSRIAALQAAIGTTDEIPEMTQERAAQHIVDLLNHLTKQQDAAKKKAAKTKPKPLVGENAAPTQPETPAAPAVPQSRGTIRDRLANAQAMILQEFGYIVHIDHESNEEADTVRLDFLKGFYKSMLEGKGGAPLDPKIVVKLGTAFAAVDQPQKEISPNITVANVNILAQEMQKHYRILEEERAGEAIDSGLPTAEEKAAEAKRLAEQLAQQKAEEEAERKRKAALEDPFHFNDLEDGGLPLA